MKIDGRQLADQLLEKAKQEVSLLTKKPHLVDILVEGTPQDESFIAAKRRATEKIGGTFECIQFKKAPEFEDFAHKIQKIVLDPKTTGIVIQKPLPPSLNTDTLYNFVPLKKEIEGHKAKTLFFPPLGLAILTLLKYIYFPIDKEDAHQIMFHMKEDAAPMRTALKRKKIVLLGTGETGGKPIAYLMNYLKLNFINLNSKTPDPSSFLKDADIIVSAVGKKIIDNFNIQPGAVLLNAGLRKEEGFLKGDYDEKDIAEIAGYFTPTPGGVGPLDVAYLMMNLVEATKMQQ